MIKGISHVTLSVKNLQVSFAFYKDTLGFRPLLRSVKNAYLLAGDLWICLEEDGSTRTSPLAEYTHAAFSVDQTHFAKVVSQIRDSGAKIFKENRSEGDSLYFLDPDGHKLEIHVGSWKSRLEHIKQRPGNASTEFFEQETAKESLTFSIERATIQDRDMLNALAFRSKCYWPYSLDYLMKCIPALHISAEYIESWPVYLAKHDPDIMGFFSLKQIDGENRLDNLWVDPRFIAKGIGRQLFARAREEAKRLGWLYFRIAADPFAEPFYRDLGAQNIGFVQSRIKPDLKLPHLELRF